MSATPGDSVRPFPPGPAFPAQTGRASAPAFAGRTTIAAARLEIAALGLIMLAGLGLRLHALTSHGIWFDEGYHIELTKLPTFTSMFEAVLSNPPSDPLYASLLRLWVALFGHGDAAVRALSAITSTATLPAVYWLGASLGRRSAGLLGALLFAVSPYAVEFGQEAALYSLAALTTTLALAAGFSFLRTGRGGALYVLLAIAAIHSSYVVALILALFTALPYAVRLDSPRMRWLVLNLLVFAAWTPWLVALLAHWASAEVPRASLAHSATPGELRGALVQYTSGSAALQQGRELLQLVGLVSGAGLTLLALALSGAQGRLFRAVLFGASASFFLPWLLSWLSGRWLFVPHFTLFFLPLLMFVLAAGALHFIVGANAYARAAALALLGLWLGAQLAGLSLYYGYPPHGADGLRTLATTLTSRSAREPLFVTPPILSATLAQYYAGAIYGLPADFDVGRVYLRYDPAAWNAGCLQRLSSVTGGRQSFWLVYRPELDRDGSFLGSLNRAYAPVEHRSYPYADLYYFAPKP